MKEVVLMMKSYNDAFGNVRPRLARFLAETFGGLPIIMNKKDAALAALQDHDVIYLFDQSYFFCPFRDHLEPILKRANRVVHIKIEYRHKLDARIQRHVTETWSSIPEDGVRYCDLNRFAFKDCYEEPSWRWHGLFYFGNIRPDRVAYMKKYLGSKLYPVHLTVNSKKNPREDLLFLPKDATIHPPLESAADLNRWRLTVYLEDYYTHNHYNSPAMRFYEALGAGLPQVFDESCIGTFNRAGFEIARYIARGPKDVELYLPHWERLLEEQRKEWIRDFAKDLRVELLQLRSS